MKQNGVRGHFSWRFSQKSEFSKKFEFKNPEKTDDEYQEHSS